MLKVGDSFLYCCNQYSNTCICIQIANSMSRPKANVTMKIRMNRMFPKNIDNTYNCAMLHGISPSQHNPLPNCKYIQTHKNENTYIYINIQYKHSIVCI